MMDLTVSTESDLQLLSLLVARESSMSSDAPEAMRSARLSLKPTGYFSGCLDLKLTFDLAKGVQVATTAAWWPNEKHDLRSLCKQATEIAKSIDALWRARDEIKAMRKSIIDAVRREITNARRRNLPYRLVSATIEPVKTGKFELPCVHVEVEMLGASLVTKVATFEFDEAEQVAPAFAEMKECQKNLRSRQVVLEAAGADGEIDEVALGIMRTQGCDVPDVLARLPFAEGGILDVDLPNMPGRKMVLFWQDGVVHANAPLTDALSWWKGRISFAKAPERFPTEPRGHLLSDFIRHEALPPHLRIIAGHRSGDDASAHMIVPTVRFNSRTGEIMAA